MQISRLQLSRALVLLVIRCRFCCDAMRWGSRDEVCNEHAAQLLVPCVSCGYTNHTPYRRAFAAKSTEVLDKEQGFADMGCDGCMHGRLESSGEGYAEEEISAMISKIRIY